MNQPAFASILWIGRGELPEFVDVRTTLGRLTHVVDCQTINSATALDPQDDCALVIVAEAFPGEHSAACFAKLRRVRSSVPIIRVYGSLCEGEMRTNPPPQAMRLPWHSAAAILSDDWQRLGRGRCPSWGRPAAATDEDRLAMDVPAEASEPLPLRRVGLRVRDPATAAWLSDFLLRLGVLPLRLLGDGAGDNTEVDAVLWDSPLSATSQDAELSDLRREYSQVPLVVLANFPRIDEVRHFRERGAAAVLAKPLLPRELEIVLRSLGEAVAR
jgi:hypothetical protein